MTTAPRSAPHPGAGTADDAARFGAPTISLDRRPCCCLRDAGPWRGCDIDTWLARIQFGAQRLLDERRHAGALPVVVGRR